MMGRFAQRVAESGLSQTELSRRTGLHLSLIKDYRRGQRVPKRHNAVRLAAALDAEPGDILLDCLHDRWEAPVNGDQLGDLWESGNQGLIARVVVHHLRGLAHVREGSDEFREAMQHAGALVLSALDRELSYVNRDPPKESARAAAVECSEL